MSFTVTISKQAEEDIRGTYEYIAFNPQSTQNAIGQIERLEKEILSPDQMPERFRAYNFEPWRSGNLGVMPVDNYLVFYIADQGKQTAGVIRVMFGGQDIAAQLDLNTD